MGIVRPWSQLPLAGIALGVALVAPVQVLADPPDHPSTQAEEVRFSVLATAANIFYVPAKIAIAAVAIPAGGLAGALSGGDARTAYAIWVPAMGGTFFLTNAHMDGSKPIEFFGSDYADQPLPQRPGQDETVIFDNAPAGQRRQPGRSSADGLYEDSTTTGSDGNYASAPYGNTTTRTYAEPYR